MRRLRGLTDIIPISIVKPYPKGDTNVWLGWRFSQSDYEFVGVTIDHLYHSAFLYEIYFKADPNYKGRYSVPVPWDKATETIVNNESAQLLRWLPTAFDSILPPNPAFNLYPRELALQIDEFSPWVQSDLNASVYKAGFADLQDSYDKAVTVVFRALNRLEAFISWNGGPFVFGKQLTELDLRIYATIVRFDAIYVQHFKCNLGTIRHDYQVIHNWLKSLHWSVNGFRELTNFKHTKENCKCAK